jgi:HEPN domain-containing protein
MATREELRELARLRMTEANALFSAGLYDGCVYLCGYVIELALKARICATLDILTYPDKRQFFKTHDFEDLKLLAGLEQEITVANPALFKSWSVATEWRPEWRYRAAGTYSQSDAEKILDAIRSEPHGILACISRRW